MRTLTLSCLALLLACSPLSAAAAAATPTSTPAESPAAHDARMSWFRDARFGMFIHWGLYSVAAGKWHDKPVGGAGEWIMQSGKIPVSEYQELVPKFNPVKFNAREWVHAAKGAGMRYIVITSKHHDGFGLWNSQLTDWCVKSTPFHRDPLKELAAACQAEGVRLCFYHSIMDWHHPLYEPRRAWNDVATGQPNFDQYNDYLKGQLRELLTGYGSLGILWFDGEWEKTWTQDRAKDLFQYVRGLQPNIIINNRIGKARAGMSGMDNGNDHLGDYGTPEQEIPPTGFGPGVDWESCMTMNGTWGYKQNDNNWKSTETLIRNLIDCASKGGNYLLNVGPTGEGLIPESSLERLAAIGKWMDLNHEAIYGTSASPFAKLPWGRCTQKQIVDTAPLFQQRAAFAFGDPPAAQTSKSTRLYLFVYDWPANGELILPRLPVHPTNAYLLAHRKSLRFSEQADGVHIQLPKAAPDPVASVVVLDLLATLPQAVSPNSTGK